MSILYNHWLIFLPEGIDLTLTFLFNFPEYSFRQKKQDRERNKTLEDDLDGKI